jgi:WD40 repeat protein
MNTRKIKLQFTRHYSFTLVWALLLTILGLLEPEMTVSSQAQSMAIYEIAVSGDRSVFAALYGGETIVDIFSNSTGQRIGSVDLTPTVPDSIAMSPNGDRIAFTDGGGALYLKSTTVENSSTEVLLPGGSGLVGALAWNPTNDTIAVAEGSAIRVINATDGVTTQVMNSSTSGGLVFELEWSPDGQGIIAVASSYHTPVSSLQIWALSSQQLLLNTPIIDLQGRGGGTAAYSPDGLRIAFTQGNTVNILDLATSTVIAERQLDYARFTSIDWSPDSSQIVTGGDKVRIWDTTQWQVVQEVAPSPLTLYTHWSQDGQHVFSEGIQGIYRDNIPVVSGTPTDTPPSSSTPPASPSPTPPAPPTSTPSVTPRIPARHQLRR